MSSALKNRLVGTAIVVAIVVIFLPDILDGKQESKRNLFIELPQKPSMKAVQTPSAFDTDRVKEAATRKFEIISEQAVDDNSTSYLVAENKSESRAVDMQVTDIFIKSKSSPVVKTSAKAKPTVSSLQEQTVVEQDVEKLLASAGWVVQLGSFRHQKNVKDLLNRLEKAGYRAFSRPVKTNSGTLMKVFVGPDLQKSNLEDALSHLKELTKLQGRVTPFTVQ